MRLLIVEDFRPLRRMVALELAENAPGVEIVGEVATGEDGVAAAAELLPDVVIMDFRLPGINGDEATRRILSSIETDVVGFVGSAEDAEALLAAGASRVFLKEDLDRMVEVLAEAS